MKDWNYTDQGLFTHEQLRVLANSFGKNTNVDLMKVPFQHINPTLAERVQVASWNKNNEYIKEKILDEYCSLSFSDQLILENYQEDLKYLEDLREDLQEVENHAPENTLLISDLRGKLISAIQKMEEFEATCSPVIKGFISLYCQYENKYPQN